MERVAVKQHHFRKTRIAASLVTALGGLAAVPYAFGDTLVPVVPPPISSYPGDPGTLEIPKLDRGIPSRLGLSPRCGIRVLRRFAGQNMNVGVVDSGYFAANRITYPTPYLRRVARARRSKPHRHKR
jgi:hypothetical protein